ncbi:MAG: hypothetical protein KDC26_03175 [Armatimonadetes bacterium]|nr:hypothetical protein [Armatimonadota bacterium]
MRLEVVQGYDHTPDIFTTRDFLLKQEGVSDAEVWMRGDAVLARVTVNELTFLSEVDLQQACMKKLGPNLTPRMIMMERAKRRAA